jgi:hypothetical protein
MYKKKAYEKEMVKTERATPMMDIKQEILLLKLKAFILGRIIPAFTQSTDIVTMICKSFI